MNDFKVDEEFLGMRVDKYLSDLNSHLSRSRIQSLIKDGEVKVNGKSIKSNYKLQKEDHVEINIPDLVEPLIEAENIPLDILYEDKELLVVNKPKKMVVHPSAGHYNGTLVNALMYHCRNELSGINGVLRPGIVHRIDMDTTGALIVCKNDLAHHEIAKQLKNHSVTRKYRAIVYHNIKEDEGVIDAPIGRHPIHRKKMAVNYKTGKPAITHYKVLERFGDFTYIECQLETGRTHQIRVHMSEHAHPLLGDMIYGPDKPKFSIQGQALHAMIIGFIHPMTHEYMEFEAPLPEYFENLLKKLR